MSIVKKGLFMLSAAIIGIVLASTILIATGVHTKLSKDDKIKIEEYGYVVDGKLDEVKVKELGIRLAVRKYTDITEPGQSLTNELLVEFYKQNIRIYNYLMIEFEDFYEEELKGLGFNKSETYNIDINDEEGLLRSLDVIFSTSQDLNDIAIFSYFYRLNRNYFELDRTHALPKNIDPNNMVSRK